MPIPRKQNKSTDHEIRRVISVCTAKHVPVWRVASTKLVEFVDSREFVVIVPDHEVEVFKRVTPAEISVTSEAKFTSQIEPLLKPKFSSRNKNRYGWYLQQFIKLAALAESKSDETYLIWDADTVPLKTLSFQTPTGLSYYRATENHTPYFNSIRKLLGLEKITPHSFIAQCFPIKGNWMHEFITLIETRNEADWLKAIADNVDFNEISGFSEYETLGTFITHRYPEEISYSDSKWLRLANSAIGGIHKINKPLSKFILKPYDFAAFEIGDKPSISKQTKHLFNRLIESANPSNS